MIETAKTFILDRIPFEPNLPLLLKRLRMKEGSPRATELVQMIEDARPHANPQALFMAAYVTGRGEDWLDIESIRFHSRVLQVNTRHAFRVFPYLATCGSELQEWAAGQTDILLSYYAEAVKEAALMCAIQAVIERLTNQFQLGHTASMNPGSLQDWPIEQQKNLFSLFGRQADEIGVSLTESMLMIPNKSVSGIRFQTEVTFESCQLCPREGCPGRRAIYDPDMYDRNYCGD